MTKLTAKLTAMLAKRKAAVTNLEARIDIADCTGWEVVSNV